MAPGREISFEPPVFYTTAREDVTIAFDMTALLINAGPPSLPETVLVQQDTQIPVAALDPPILSGPLVQQRLRGLTSGKKYRLYVSVLTNTMRREGDLLVDVAHD